MGKVKVVSLSYYNGKTKLIFLFVIFLIGTKEFHIHISKAGAMAKELESKGIKYTIQ
jgi:hypothetical protein